MMDLARAPSSPTQFARLPKVELHGHLEGSLRLESLCAIGRELQLDVPHAPAALGRLV